MHTYGKAMLRISALPVSLLPELEKQIINEIPLDETVLAILMEAIYTASPGFYALLVKAGALNGIFPGEKLKISVLKYLNRICQRGTPFSTMSAVSLIPLGEETTSIAPASAPLQKIARLDAAVANALINKLQSGYNFDDSVLLYANNSVYQIDGRLRYIESVEEQGLRKFRLSAVDIDEVILAVLNYCKSGRTKLAVIALLISDDDELDPADVAEYIDDLLQNGILLSSLSLKSSDVAILPQLIALPSGGAEFPEVRERLKALHAAIGHIKDTTPAQTIPQIQKITTMLGELLGEPGSESSVLQIDSYKNLACVLNRQVAQQLGKVLLSMSRIIPDYESPDLNAFKEEFSRRYDQQAIPLLTCLDPDLGIGYPVSKRITFPENDELLSLLEAKGAAASAGHKVQYFCNDWFRFLIDKYKQARVLGLNEINISLKEMKPFERENAANVPPSLTVLAKLSAASAAAVDRGAYLLYPFDLHAPSAANVYARFSPLHPEIKDFIGEILDKEEEYHEGALLVELEHTGQLKTANVNLKDFNRSWRLNIADAPAGTDSGCYLELSDLYLRVLNNKIVLFSKKMRKQVIPFMTTAYNYRIDELPVISFLGDLQNQGNQNSLLWDWGLLREFNYLPRVTIEHNIVISPAQWNVKKSLLHTGSFELFRVSLREICRKEAIPRRVFYGDADNLLLLDLHQDLYLKILYKDLKTKDDLLFQEHLNAAENRYVSDGDNNYDSQLLFSYYRTKDPAAATADGQAYTVVPSLAYLPGEEWIYLKLYFNSFQAEETILHQLHDLLPLIRQEVQSLERWFFIRFTDPEPHLRLRFKIGHPEDISTLIIHLNKAFKALVHSGLIHRIHYDSYQPETERYGVQQLPSVEEIFSADAEAILALRIALSGNFKADQMNWLIGVYNLDWYLSLFYTGEEHHLKMAYVKQISKSLKQEFNFSGQDFKKLNSFFQRNKPLITAFLEDPDQRYHQLHLIFAQRDQQLRRFAGQLQLSTELIFSIIHMSMNRLFPVDPRKKEALCYDLYPSVFHKKHQHA